MQLKYFRLPLILILAGLIAACSNQLSTSGNQSSKNTADWKMGVALYSFNMFPFSATLQKADSAGAKYVEGFSFHNLKGEFRDSTIGNLSTSGLVKMKRLLDSKGLKMKSMYAGGKDAKEWESYFKAGKLLGIEFIVCEPAKEHWDLLDSLGDVYKIKTAIHEHAKGESRYWHPDSVLAAIKGRKNIGACADLGHWARSGLDPAKCLNMLRGHILGVHLKDNKPFGNIKAEDVTVGTGNIDFKAVVKELKAQKFNGYIYVECEHNWENNVPDVAESIRYFNNLANQQN
jgi:sugar phosphate isomerase/epimerase